MRTLDQLHELLEDTRVSAAQKARLKDVASGKKKGARTIDKDIHHYVASVGGQVIASHHASLDELKQILKDYGVDPKTFKKVGKFEDEKAGETPGLSESHSKSDVKLLLKALNGVGLNLSIRSHDSGDREKIANARKHLARAARLVLDLSKTAESDSRFDDLAGLTESSDLSEAEEIDISTLPSECLKLAKSIKHAKLTTAFDGIHGRIMVFDVSHPFGGFRLTKPELTVLTRSKVFRWLEVSDDQLSIGC